MPEICLVQMPFASVEHPSIGLSLLKAGVEQAGMACRVFYPNLDFAERIGVRRYKLVDRCFTEDLVGEWLFSGAAFPDYRPDPSTYLDSLNLSFWKNARDELHEIRAEAAPFVDEVAREILSHKPRLVGCSSVFAQNCASLALLRRLKELDPEVVTVLGGANCEGVMGQTQVRTFHFLDYVVSGEADLLFPELCRGNPGYGVLTREKSEPVRAVVDQLDQVPTPDFDDYFEALEHSSIRAHIEPGLMVESSRGCWWGSKHHCTFCGLNGTGMGYRSKSPERVVEEFDHLYARHRVDGFEVVDNIIDMKHLNTVLPVFAERGAPYRIFYETKSNLKRSQVELLARSGVKWVQPGIESMHSEVLKLMDKGSTALINVCLLKWAREFGVRLSWNFLCDFPDERDEWYLDMASWLPLIAHLQPPGGLHRVRFDRFSPYHTRPADYGIEIVPFDSYRAVYPLNPEDLANLAYFFRGLGRKGTGNRPGLRALCGVVDEWKETFWKSPLPIILSSRRTEQGVEILDTRPLAPRRRVLLEGLEAEVFEACHEPRNPSSLSRSLGRGWEELEDAVERLKDRRLLLELDGKLVTLAVEGSLPTLPGGADFPGGVLYDTPCCPV